MTHCPCRHVSPHITPRELDDLLRRSAADLADRYGWSLTPLAPNCGGDSPMWRWKRDNAYSNDPGDIYANLPWCANFAVLTGISRLVVTDEDTNDDHDGVNLALDICELETGARHWPASYTVATRHGYHRYWADPAGRWRNSQSKLADGIDVRAVGGITVAPGSVRDGLMYTCLDDRVPETPPAWWAKRLDAVEAARGGGSLTVSRTGRPQLKTKPQQAKQDREYRRNRDRWAKRPMNLLIRVIDAKIDQLAVTSSGRNPELFKTAAYIAPALHRLDEDIVTAQLLHAMKLNRGLAERGESACRDTIRRGLHDAGWN
jgi:hypothetical protein